MKKLILAATITAITAASAQAATLYEGKGLVYQLKGDFQVQLRKDLKKEGGKKQNLDIEFDDLELQNRVEYKLDDDLTAFGQLDFGFKKAAENEQAGGEQVGSHLEEAYVGLDFGDVRVAFGKMDFASDEFGVEQAYENQAKEDRFDAQDTNGDDVIRVDAKFGKLDLVASYELEAENEESDENGKFLDLYVGTKIEGVELAAAYQSKKPLAKSSEDTWGVSAEFDAGVAKLGADYSSTDMHGNDNDVDQLNLVAVIPVAKTTKVALGIARIDEDTKKKVTEWYANVTYQFEAQKNVSLFAEIADNNDDDMSLGYLAGMRIKF